MRRSLTLVAATLLGLGLSLPASAKGPLRVELVISGEGLERDVRVPADDMYRAQRDLGMQIFGYIGSPTPDRRPPFMYRLDYRMDPTESEPLVSYLYYPGDGTRPAILRDPACVGTDMGCWGAITAQFDGFLRAYLAGTPPPLAPPGPPILGPLTALSLLLAPIWFLRRPPIRRRLARLAY